MSAPERLRDDDDGTSPAAEARRLVSLSTPAPEITLAGFLRHARGAPRFCWDNAREQSAFAASGVALEISGWGEARFGSVARKARALFEGALIPSNKPLAAPQLFGGFAFRADFLPDRAWADFPPAHFVLPHFQLARAGGEAWLTINALAPWDDDPEQVLPDLAAALAAKRNALETELSTDAPAPKLSALDYPMSYDDWTRAIHALTREMAGPDRALDKAVLARAAEAHFDRAPDVDRALSYLAERYPGTYRFLFEPRAGHAFFGATPELLVRVNGLRLETMALAGSIGRGKTPAEDVQLGAELLASAKDRSEHAIVITAIQRVLQPFACAIHTGDTGLLKLSNIQHLHTPVTAELQGRLGVLPLVEALHPTPALGGQPRARAMAAIAAQEPVTRGWYAGPIGMLDARLDGAFAVGIRSAVAESMQQRAWLYAGCGIVAESEPEREWRESALKFKPMLEALGIREGR